MAVSNVNQLDRAREVMEEGRALAADRFSRFPVLRDRLCAAPLREDAAAKGGIEVVPPSADDPRGVVLFDRECVQTLSREHRHPEWVVCARIERMVTAQTDAWETDDAERERLVAHREMRRTKSAERASDTPRA